MQPELYGGEDTYNYYFIFDDKHIIAPVTHGIKDDSYTNVCNDLETKLFDKIECNFNYPYLGFIDNTSLTKQIVDIYDTGKLPPYKLFKNLLYLAGFASNNSSYNTNLLMFIKHILFDNSHWNGNMLYLNSIAVFDENYNMISISSPFLPINCSKTGVNFTCGLQKQDDPVECFTICYAVDDALSFIATIKKDDLKFVDPSQFDIKNALFLTACNSDTDDTCIKSIYQIIEELDISVNYKEIMISVLQNEERHVTMTLARKLINTILSENEDNPFYDMMSILKT